MLHRYRSFRAAPVLALICFAAAAGSAADFRIVVNNKTLDTSTQGPVVVRGSLLVPLSAIGNAMGAYLEWRSDTRTVYGRRNSNEFLLPVNSGTATVNGATQALDTPASIIGGRTMVPLRFVATALGAEVAFEGSTKTVFISTSGGGATTPPPTTTGSSVSIDRFYITPNRALRAGDTYTVTLEGTPGAKAEYDEGSRKGLAMKEVSAGKYVASATIPANGAFGRSAVVGRLTLGGSSRDVQAGDRLVVDTQSPLVKAPLPKAGTKVATDQPYISAELDDQSQTGVDPESVHLFVNDTEVTSEAAVTSSNVVYRGTLEPGEVKVKLTVADHAGNVGTAQWSFTVGEAASAELPPSPVIVSPKEDTKVSGALIVSGTAAKGATVRVRVTYTGTALVVFSQDGEVGTQEVKAGADGAWKTGGFTLPKPSGLRDITYTITATATDAKGLTSEPATLTLQRG